GGIAPAAAGPRGPAAGAAVGDALAAERLDLRDDVLRRLAGAAAAVDRAAEIVHHHARTAPCQLERMGPAEPAACSRDDRDPAVESNGHAVSSSLSLLTRTAASVERVDGPGTGRHTDR